MDAKRRVKLMMRWSLLTAGLIALFWGVWYGITGSVPVISEIKMTESWTIQLPFAMSRWWDILMGPIVSCVLILVLTNKRLRDNKDTRGALILGLVYGLAVGVVYGLAGGLAVWLVVGLVYGLAVGVVVELTGGLVYGLAVRLVYGLAVWLVVGLVYGLAFGLAGGLVYGLVVGLANGLVYGLVAGIKLLLSSQTWTAVRNWLLAR